VAKRKKIMDWFRSHHGAPSDSKWLVIARKAKVQPVAVVAVFWSLLDYASQQESRGDIEGFDPESVAAFLGIEDDEVAAIMTAFEDKGITDHGRIANWDKRQPKREREDDLSTARSQRFRAKKASAEQATPEQPHTDNATPCNAMQRHATPRLDKIREDILPPTPFKSETPKETTTKAFSLQDPLPLHVQNFLTESCPDFYEAHLRLALVGRSPNGLASYALEILRGWKRGINAPQAPLPDVPIHAAPPETPLPPGARILSLAEVRARRAAQEATHAALGGSHATQ
jgi:hypothetical protein